MPLLKKITTRYDQSEDRFRITTLAEDESVRSLWITQRLLLRLIPTVLSWLDGIKTSNPQIDTQSQRFMNDFARQEALADLKPETPVSEESLGNPSYSTPSNKTLVHEITISYSDDSISLAFKDKENLCSKLDLTKKTARQWVLIIHSQWLLSGWTASVWPDWLNSPISKPKSEMH